MLCYFMLCCRKAARGACTSHSAQRSSGFDDSGTCSRSLRSERVVLSRVDACRSIRKWRLFLRRLSGMAWETLGGMARARAWDRREGLCRLFGMQLVSRDLGSGRGRRQCDWMRTSRSGYRDLEGECLLHKLVCGCGCVSVCVPHQAT